MNAKPVSSRLIFSILLKMNSLHFLEGHRKMEDTVVTGRSDEDDISSGDYI